MSTTPFTMSAPSSFSEAAIVAFSRQCHEVAGPGKTREIRDALASASGSDVVQQEEFTTKTRKNEDTKENEAREGGV